jgi:HSP20 family protein
MEEENKLRVEVELPGVPKDNIRLVLTNDYVIVSTLKPQSSKESHAFVCQNERHFGNFYRQLFFPFLVDTTTAAAVLDKGGAVYNAA